MSAVYRCVLCVVCVVCASVWVGCGPPEEEMMPGGGSSLGGEGGEAVGCVDRTWTCAEVMAAMDGVDGDVSIACTDGAEHFTLTTTGVPTYTSNQTTPNDIAAQGWTVTLPMKVSCAATSTDTIESRGEIAFALNGIPLYGPQDFNGGDAIINEGPTLDDCKGHADNSCTYHYHSEPVCVFGPGVALSTKASADGHSAIVAFALDGFPIYAIDNTATDLDACNGHYDETRGYHYHATTGFPYTIACLAGDVLGKATREGASSCSSGGMGRPMP